MVMGRRGSGCRYAQTLFRLGSVGALTDGELLSRFASGGGEAAELAFAALVERHGPMVLRVCRSILSDEHDAQDALQATFLVLVRRAGSVRDQDSVASWLHGVALRVAGCARVSAARRRRHERRAAELVTEDFLDVRNEPDLAPALHEELGRLPEQFRAVIVLCYLEGLACEAAAVRLGLAVGTVKSRLARGRERLRGRLIRRGLAPSAGLLATLLSTEAASAAPPTMVAASTARIAMGLAAGEAAGLGAVSASVSAITRRIVMMTSLGRFLRVAGAALVLAASIGIGAMAERTSADPPRAKAPATRAAQAKVARLGEDPTRVRPEPVLEKALRAAEQITVPWMKAHALADIAAAQARVGQAERSRVAFGKAAEIIDGIGDDPFHKAANLSWLARAETLAGDRPRARATIAQILVWAAKIDDVPRRRIIFWTAATEQAKAGDPEGALELVRALGDSPAGMRASALAEIAGAQAKAGDLPRARATTARADAEAARDEEEPKEERRGPLGPLDPMRLARVRGLAALAAAEAKAGELDAARATLRRARAVAGQIGEEYRPPPLAEIAMAQRETGDRDAADATLGLALKTAEGLKDPGRAVDSLARVAIAQADWGDHASARATLSRALQIGAIVPAHNGLIQQDVSTARARVGDWEGGREAALGQSDQAVRARHVEGLSFEKAKAGEARAALEWAETPTDSLLRTHAFLGIVRGIIEPKTRPAGK